MHIRYTLATLSAMASLAAIGYVAMSQPATAQAATPDPDTISIRVPYGDLNLDTRDGAEAMLRRVHHAAKSICGVEPSDVLDGRVRYRACVRDTVDRAVAKLGNSTVTALNTGGRADGQVMIATARP